MSGTLNMKKTLTLTSEAIKMVGRRTESIRKLQKSHLIGNIGSCLAIGCYYGYDIKALRDADASRVYGLENLGCALNVAVSSGLLEKEYALHANIFDLPLLHRKGMIPREGFDTVTALNFPSLHLQEEIGTDNGYSNFVERTLREVEEIVGVRKYFPDGLAERKTREYSFSNDPVVEALCCMLASLKPEGNLILSLSPDKRYKDRIKNHPDYNPIIQALSTIKQGYVVSMCYINDNLNMDLALITARKGLNPQDYVR